MSVSAEDPRRKEWDALHQLPKVCAEFPETDTGNARRFNTQFKDCTRFVPGRGWCVYDGVRWFFDDRAVMQLAKQMTDEILQECRFVKDETKAKTRFKHYLQSQQLQRLNAMLKLSESESDLAGNIDEFDTWQDHINAPNGIVNLVTGELEPHNPEAKFSKVAGCPYDPDANCPTFEKFIEEVIPNPELRDYIQRAIGYSFTGHTQDQVYHQGYGDGGNGKSVFFETILDIAGEFGMTTSHETFIVHKNNSARPDIARLPGIRFLLTSEVEDSNRIDEALIKDLTGGDRVMARHLYQEPIEFLPRFKLWIRGNYLPRIRGTDEGIWRRVRLVPFEVNIPENKRDKNLRDKIKKELPGVFAWIIKGAVRYYQEGLSPVPNVLAAIDDYRQSMDMIGRFISECCLLSDDAKAQPAQIYRAFFRWAHATGEFPIPERKFSAQLEKRGIKRWRSNGKRWWKGIGIIDDSAEVPESDAC